jgi:hypothetical protein
MQHGANLKTSDGFNRNALVHACTLGHINDEAIIILLRNGGTCISSIPFVSNRLHPPISLLRPLIMEKKFAIARMLIQSGYNVANQAFSSDDFRAGALFKENYGFVNGCTIFLKILENW